MTECRIRLSFFSPLFWLNPVFACSTFAYQRHNATTGVTLQRFYHINGASCLVFIFRFLVSTLPYLLTTKSWVWDIEKML